MHGAAADAAGDATDARVYPAAAMQAPRSGPAPRADGDAYLFGKARSPRAAAKEGRLGRGWPAPGKGAAGAGPRQKPTKPPPITRFFSFFAEKIVYFLYKRRFFYVIFSKNGESLV